jgi:hypothetical protein
VAVAVHPSHSASLQTFRCALALRRALAAGRADVVHLHDHRFAPPLRLAMLGRRRVPVVEQSTEGAVGEPADTEAVARALIDAYRHAIAEHRHARSQPFSVFLAPLAWSLLHGCDLLLRVAGLERTLAFVGARGAWDTTDGTEGPSSFYTLSRPRRYMTMAIQSAGSRWRRSDGPCLRRALATSLVLRKYRPVIHFGVKRGEETPLAHAWVTVGSLRFDPDRSYEAFQWGTAA